MITHCKYIDNIDNSRFNNNKNKLIIMDENKITSATSIWRGYKELKVKDLKQAKIELMTAIGRQDTIGTKRGHVFWHNLLIGLRDIRLVQAREIEKVFSKYGITDVWGV